MFKKRAAKAVMEVYDVERCRDLDELKELIYYINSHGWAIVGLADGAYGYTVIFRRPADG